MFCTWIPPKKTNTSATTLDALPPVPLVTGRCYGYSWLGNPCCGFWGWILHGGACLSQWNKIISMLRRDPTINLHGFHWNSSAWAGPNVFRWFYFFIRIWELTKKNWCENIIFVWLRRIRRLVEKPRVFVDDRWFPPLRQLQKNMFEYIVDSNVVLFYIYLAKMTTQLILGRYDSNQPGSIGSHVWPASPRDVKEPFQREQSQYVLTSSAFLVLRRFFLLAFNCLKTALMHKR